MSSQLTAENRKEVFLSLIKEQDAGSTLEHSRQRMSDKFTIDVAQVIAIEQQGRLNRWPPLA